MGNFIQGMLYFIAGFKRLSTPGLRRFVILPILFNVLLFAGLFYLLYHYLLPYADYYLDKLPSWLSFLSTVFFILVVVSFFLLFLMLFTALCNVIAAPFNGLLAEKAQTHFLQSELPSQPFMVMAWRSIKRQGQFLRYFLPRFLLTAALFFVPFIQPVYPFIWFTFNAWMLSMQYQDFVMDNNLFTFNAMKQRLQHNRMKSLGFGLMINVFNFIPLLNVLTMPSAVIGGVLLYGEEQANLHKRLNKKPA